MFSIILTLWLLSGLFVGLHTWIYEIEPFVKTHISLLDILCILALTLLGFIAFIIYISQNTDNIGKIIDCVSCKLDSVKFRIKK